MRIHHLALRTRRLEQVTHFYRDVLGLKERERRPNGSVWFAAGDAILMVEAALEGEPAVPEGSMDFLSFRIAPNERAAFSAKLEEAGVRVEAETPFTLYVRDPDGRRVGVSHFPDPV